jgi:nicotinamidase-related amidase
VTAIELDPRRTGLVVFDMLECYRPAAEAAGAIEPAQRLVRGCRAAGVPVFWARADHRSDGADFATALTDTDAQLRPWGPEHAPPDRPPHGSGSPMLHSLAELGQQPGDYDVPKHRWSAFHGTQLELSLRARGVDTILLIGGSTHVGIAATAFDARDQDFTVVLVRDALTGFAMQREFLLEHVFPRMARVRSVDEVLTALRAL